MKDLLIYHNLGLGDSIICNGLVRHFAKDRNVFVFCKTHNAPSVRFMFSDDPRIVCVDVEDDAATDRVKILGNCDVMRLTGSGHGFDRQMYEQAGVPFEQRWDGFYAEWPRPNLIKPPAPPYMLVHDDPERGFVIPPSVAPLADYPPVSHAIHANRRSPNIFDWLAVLECAAVIHCIPSSFSVLVDSIGTHPEQKLFLHTSARPNGELPTYRKQWTRV